MKAITYTKYGPPNVLQYKEVNKPQPKDNEVLVKVFATTVNRTDLAIVSGKPYIMRLFIGLFKPSNPIPGTDFAGLVEAVGKDVKKFKVGDKVFGFNDEGLSSQAQYLTIAEDKALSTIPNNLDYQQAVASLEGAHYAYNFIIKIKLESGQKVLVNGATGAIGSAALQMLKYFETEVTAVCNTKNMERIKSLGADRVINYETHDFTKENSKYDFVFDAVGKSSFGKCKPLLNPGGIYISSELGWGAQNIFYALTTPLLGGKKVKFPLPTNIKRSINFIKEIIEKGQFEALIDRHYPLKEIADAYTYVSKGQKTGNVIIKIEHL